MHPIPYFPPPRLPVHVPRCFACVRRTWSAAFGIDNLNNATYWAFHPYPQRTYSAELRYHLRGGCASPASPVAAHVFALPLCTTFENRPVETPKGFR